MPHRRDMLQLILGAPLAAQLAGCDDDERAVAHVEGEILGPSMDRGHRLRDGELPDEAAWARAPARRTGTVIVGGGPAGLSAAWRLARRGQDDFELVELEPSVGGTSVSGESDVTKYPWGAHYIPVPMAHNVDLIALLREMGAITGVDARGEPVGAEEILVRVPDERLFFDGFWYAGLYPYAGASPDDLAELARFRGEIDRLAALRDGTGRRAFAIPVSMGSDDGDVYALDRVTAAEWLDREGYRSRRLRWLLEYACRDDYGLTLETTSAWAMLFYYAARTPAPGRDTMELLTWPEGNDALVRHLASAAERRVRTGLLVVDVVPSDGGVTVRALDAGAGPQVIAAERAIVAVPRFVAQRIVRGLGADEGFTYGAWMVANLHLADRPAWNGYPMCWDNVLHDSPSLGYVCATHQRGREHGPTVLTHYMPLTDDDAAAGRRRLLEPSWEGWRDAIAGDLSRAHRDLRAHLRRLDVWRWGHAMIRPRVGFVSSPARRRAAEPLGRVHFAHSDLSGVALFEEAFFHGVRAADEVVRAREPA